MEERLKKFTLPRLFSVAIDSYSDDPFVAYSGQTPITYQEFAREVNRIRYLLEKSGIGEGEKVVILDDNSPNWCVAFSATTKMPGIVVPVIYEFPESDINHILNHSKAIAIFIDDKFYDSMDFKALN
jgi:long-chain acyl-CoA synthetase